MRFGGSAVAGVSIRGFLAPVGTVGLHFPIGMLLWVDLTLLRLLLHCESLVVVTTDRGPLGRAYLHAYRAQHRSVGRILHQDKLKRTGF